MISTYSDQHIDEVYKIEEESFNNPWIKPQFLRYSSGFNESMSYIYSQGSIITGYLMAETILDEVHIHNIVVKRAFRNNSIAKKLIHHLIDKSKICNKNKVCLEVNCSNILALKLYESFGFIEVGKRKKYYQDRKDAILMDLYI